MQLYTSFVTLVVYDVNEALLCLIAVVSYTFITYLLDTDDFLSLFLLCVCLYNDAVILFYKWSMYFMLMRIG